jgi:hypothetical protein
MAPVGETSLVAEVPCFQDDPVYACADDAPVARVVDELARVGLVRAREVVESRHHLLPNAYPVYALGWSRTVAEVVAGLGAIRNRPPRPRRPLLLQPPPRPAPPRQDVRARAGDWCARGGRARA